MNINAALGMTSERPLQVERDEVEELLEQVRILSEICDDIRDTFGYSRDDMVDLTTYVAQDYAELREQLSDTQHELENYKRAFGKALSCVDSVFQPQSTPEAILPEFCTIGDDKFEAVPRLAKEFLALKQQLERVTKERDEAWKAHKVVTGHYGRVVKERDAEALRADQAESETSAVPDQSADDQRIADLERQLAERDRDAELRRELRAWIKNGVFSVVGYSLVIGCQCVPAELAELLVSIRDGGAK